MDQLLALLSPEMIEDQFFQSMLHLHSQPPAMNGLVGMMYRLFPSGYSMIFHLFFGWMGLLADIYDSGVGSRVRSFTKSRHRVCITLVCDTSVCALRKFLFYTLPVAALLAASLFHSIRALRDPKRHSPKAIFWALCLTLTRSIFHPLWLGVFVVAHLVLLMKHKQRSRLTWGAAGLALLLVSGWMIKNKVLFDRATMSTWTGMNMARVTR